MYVWSMIPPFTCIELEESVNHVPFDVFWGNEACRLKNQARSLVHLRNKVQSS